MELQVTPLFKNANCTISHLFIGDKFECFILEDVDRGLKQFMPLADIKAKKVHAKTCIPEGRYEIEITYSNRFKKPLPLLLSVPGFEGIRIHPGNTAENTEGCLLPGTEVKGDSVINSRVAFAALFNKIQDALKTEKVFIIIRR